MHSNLLFWVAQKWNLRVIIDFFFLLSSCHLVYLWKIFMCCMPFVCFQPALILSNLKRTKMRMNEEETKIVEKKNKYRAILKCIRFR